MVTSVADGTVTVTSLTVIIMMETCRPSVEWNLILRLCFDAESVQVVSVTQFPYSGTVPATVKQLPIQQTLRLFVYSSS